MTPVLAVMLAVTLFVFAFMGGAACASLYTIATYLGRIALALEARNRR